MHWKSLTVSVKRKQIALQIWSDITGKQNSLADTLSRYPILITVVDDKDFNELIEEVLIAVTTHVVASSYVTDDDTVEIDHSSIETATADNQDYQLLSNRVRNNNWPDSIHMVKPALTTFYNGRSSDICFRPGACKDSHTSKLAP